MLQPQAHISEQELDAGLARMVREAWFSGSVSALTGGAVLTALGLHLGASNLTIGVLASAPFITQLLQVPGIALVERTRQRKRIAVVSSIVGRILLVVMGLAALTPGPAALAVVIAAQFILCAAGAIGGCAWNSWVRDLAPQQRLGEIFARRNMWTAAVGLIASMAAAAVLALTAPASTGRGTAFAAMFAIGCAGGLISAWIVARMPEPEMAPATERVGLIALIRLPLRDANFLRLMRFVISWQAAANFAAPFLTVFMVRQLGLGVELALVMGAISQLANVAVLRSWGHLSDSFANKSVLQFCAPLSIAATVAMVAVSQMEGQATVIAWLAVLHALLGAAVAGITLCSANIALKLSPRGSATAYLAANAMASALAAGLAPIVGGLLADFFAARRFQLTFQWTSPDGDWMFPFTIHHWDFYFLISGVIGLYALHRLSLVREEGEIDPKEMAFQVWLQARRTARNISSVAGLRAATELPTTLLHEARVRARWLRQAGRRDGAT